MTSMHKHPIHKHPFHRLGCKSLCGVCLTWHSPLPGQWMGGRRHPASGGVDGLCNKNTRREARKRRLAAGKQRRQHGDSFRLSPLHSHGRFSKKQNKTSWGILPSRAPAQLRRCMRFFFFLSNRHGEITVLYPSLADWSESPPYSALPRPGVEPLEKNRQLYSCVLHAANPHGRQVEHKGLSFRSNCRNNQVGQFEETADGNADRARTDDAS